MQIRSHLARSHRALTLLELTVTFIILALLAAVALPTYQTATTNVALLRDEAALVDLATVAQTVSVQHGASIPNSADYTPATSSLTQLLFSLTHHLEPEPKFLLQNRGKYQ
jgi:Tfp pilus assembly protein PilE